MIRLKISSEFLCELLTTGNEMPQTRIIDGLPKGAQLVAATKYSESYHYGGDENINLLTLDFTFEGDDFFVTTEKAILFESIYK